jgi:hypothetical protein
VACLPPLGRARIAIIKTNMEDRVVFEVMEPPAFDVISTSI